MISFRRPTLQQGWRYCRWLIAVSIPLLWWALPGPIASTLFIPAWVIVAQFIFAGLVERAHLRRRAWLGQYLEVTSPWHRRLRAGLIVMVWNQLLGLILAPILLISLRHLADTDWPILLLASGMFVFCNKWFKSRLQGHVIADYLPALTRQLTVLPLAGLLTLTLAFVAMWRPQPYLINMTWEAAMHEHLPTMSGQTLLGALERIAGGFELSGFWLMQNALDNLAVSSYVAVLGWAALLLMQGTLAWSFIRLLAGVATVAGHIFTDSKHRPAPCEPTKDE